VRLRTQCSCKTIRQCDAVGTRRGYGHVGSTQHLKTQKVGPEGWSERPEQRAQIGAERGGVRGQDGWFRAMGGSPRVHTLIAAVLKATWQMATTQRLHP
jgi:hypothetical protein